MKPNIIFLSAGLLLPTATFAASPLDGIWKADLSTLKASGKPVELSLKDGVYKCLSCVPAVTVAADGKAHAVTNDPYYDSRLVRVVSPYEVDSVSSKGGKVVLRMHFIASADGKTISVKTNDATATSGATTTFSWSARRVKPAPAGAHAISGDWMIATGDASENAQLETLKVDGDMLTMTLPTGQSYTAMFGGPQAPYNGDPGTDSVAVTRLGTRGFKEIDYRKGKVLSVGTFTVAADGKTGKSIVDFNGERDEIIEKKQ